MRTRPLRIRIHPLRECSVARAAMPIRAVRFGGKECTVVRPIEISDVLSKVQAAERLQQNAKALPEAAQQFQRELGDKLAGEQVTVTQPPPPGDRIILHEEERKKNRQGKREKRKNRGVNSLGGESPDDDSDQNPPAAPGHIDIRV